MTDRSRPLRAVHQLVPALSRGDAVGNLVRTWRAALEGEGFESRVFAGMTDAASAGEVERPESLPDQCGDDSVVIVHHSFESRQVPLLRRTRGRKLLAYHNVTPSWFFDGLDSRMARACEGARDELRELAPLCEGAVAFSRFSAEEAVAAGVKHAQVIPFAVAFERTSAPPDPELLATLSDGAKNVLFVGRLVPNKLVEDVLRVFTAYQQLFQRDSRLVIAGELNRFSPYLEELEALRGYLGADRVVLLGKVTEAQLSACFATAHAYLSMSRHEGFGVPLLEAMHRSVPVVAYGAAAVPETMAGAGVTVRTPDPIDIARVLRVLEDADVRERALGAQAARIAAHRAADPTGALVRVVTEGVTADPTLPPPVPAHATRVICPELFCQPDSEPARSARALIGELEARGEDAVVLGLGGPGARAEGASEFMYLPELPAWDAATVRSAAMETAAAAGSGPVIVLREDTAMARALRAKLGKRVTLAQPSTRDTGETR